MDTVDLVVTSDARGFAVAAVNKDPVNRQTVDFSFLDAAPREMRVHTLNGPSCDDYNDIDRTEVGVAVSDWLPFDGSAALAPHSVNVLELR